MIPTGPYRGGKEDIYRFAIAIETHGCVPSGSSGQSDLGG
jgi:hypothetical protein